MPSEISTGKTIFILAAVVGCFAVLWPRLFSPMLQSALYQKSSLDNTAGCCDVISDRDVNAIRILTEMCGRIITKHEELDPKFLSDFAQGRVNKEVLNTCKREVLNTCGVDITTLLAEQVGLGRTYREILDNIKTFNNSVCLKQNFGMERGLLGAARHWSHTPLKNIRQERPPHMRPDLISAALRERGRAIPQSNVVPRILEGRPGPIPGMRPPMGGPGHVVPPPKATQGALGILMPLYTIGIVMIFVYTMMKLLTRRSSDAESASSFQSDPNFRHYVFSDQHGERNGTNKYRYDQPTKLVETAISGLLAEVDRQRDSVAKRAEQPSGKGENGLQTEPKREAEGDQEAASVKVVNMETTASCEGGKPWTGSRPTTPTQRSRPPSRPPTPLEREAATIPPPQDAQEIYLEGALPSQAQLLVAESETESHKVEGDEDLETRQTTAQPSSPADRSSDVTTPEEAHALPTISGDKKKRLTFAFSDQDDDILMAKDNKLDSESLTYQTGENSQNPYESFIHESMEEGNVLSDDNIKKLEKLATLDREYLQNEIENIIEQAIECVEQEMKTKEYLDRTELESEGDYNEEDGEGEIEYVTEEEELGVDEEEDEEEEEEDEIGSDILDAIKESEKIRKAVHEKVEEVNSSMSSIVSGLQDDKKLSKETPDVRFDNRKNDTKSDKVKSLSVEVDEEEELEEEEEEEDEGEEVEEEVEEEELEDEEVEEEETDEDEVNPEEGKGSMQGGAKENHHSDNVAVDHEVEYEDDETEEEEEEVEDEEDVDGRNETADDVQVDCENQK